MKTFISTTLLCFFTMFSASAHVVAIVKQGFALGLSGNKNTISASMFDAGSYLDEQSVVCKTPLIFSFDAEGTLLTVDLGQVKGLNCIRVYVTNPCDLNDQAYVDTYIDQQLTLTPSGSFPLVENMPLEPTNEECGIYLSPSMDTTICNPVAIARQGIGVSVGSSGGKGVAILTSALDGGSYGNCGTNLTGLSAVFPLLNPATDCATTALPAIPCVEGLVLVRLIVCSGQNSNFVDTYIDYQKGGNFCNNSTSCAPTVIAMQGIAVKRPPSGSFKIYPKHLDAGSFVSSGCGAITKLGISLTDTDIEEASLTFDTANTTQVYTLRLYATNLLNGKSITNWADAYIQVQEHNLVATTEMTDKNPFKVYLSDNYLILSGDVTPKAVTIVNTLGQTVLSSNSASKQLNCAGLSAGIYYVQVVEEQGKRQVVKFFKN